MKKYIYFIIICVVSVAFTSCPTYTEENTTDAYPDYYPSYPQNDMEKIWKGIEGYIESDVGISAERPFPNVLSEKEALIRAYSIMAKRGFFSPSNYMFTNAPCLLTAKVARPMLIYNFAGSIGQAVVFYRHYAVSDNGEVLIQQNSAATASLGDNELLSGGQSAYGHDDDWLALHFITEGELIELIKSQFGVDPDERPIIVVLRLIKHPYSSSVPFWYFTVNDVEYIVGLHVFDWNLVSAAGGVANHAAISLPSGNGVGVIGGERMARLDTRADFYKAIRDNKESAVDNRFPYIPPQGGWFQWTAVPLK
jgi:hypothetical protein